VILTDVISPSPDASPYLAVSEAPMCEECDPHWDGHSKMEQFASAAHRHAVPHRDSVHCAEPIIMQVALHSDVTEQDQCHLQTSVPMMVFVRRVENMQRPIDHPPILDQLWRIVRSCGAQPPTVL
jgi:hypothetical protein